MATPSRPTITKLATMATAESSTGINPPMPTSPLNTKA